jgi:ferredoxin
MTRITVDHDACMGTAFCERIAPLLFRVDEATRLSSPLVAVVPPNHEDAAREAADACPAAAIEVIDE